MKLDEVVTGLCLCNDIALNFVRCVDSRFVHEGTSGVDCRSEQRAGLNLFAPFQCRRRAAQIHDRRYAVSEINRSIAEIISRRHDWGSGHMNMRVRQTGNEVLPRTVNHHCVGRHIHFKAGANGNNPVPAHQHGPTLFDAFAV